MEKKILIVTCLITICTTLLAITLALKNEFFFSVVTLFVGLMFVYFISPDEIEMHEADNENH